MKLMPDSIAVNTAVMPSFSLISWKTPPKEEAPKLREETFIPVFPISWYCITLCFMIMRQMYAVNEPGRPWTLLKKHVMVYVNSCSLALPALFRDMITVGLPAEGDAQRSLCF